MTSTFLATISLLIPLMMSAYSTTTAKPSRQMISSDITTTWARATLPSSIVMLIRMVQEKIPHNNTFLLSNPMLEFLSKHSISAPLMFDDLIRLPNGTVAPTPVTNIRHQKLYFNGIELTTWGSRSGAME
ncbi:hypothetical protein U9M48_031211 [Paspalum notatum var. saurae]|uniref:FAS1 domain-containing protein n=1 Tax=Paspalum notatum var. saurae TaxID=547442 RepID=A0AAQ3U6Y7_PASNO